MRASTTQVFDVLVVGAGGAGLRAVIEAADAGVSVGVTVGVLVGELVAVLVDVLVAVLVGVDVRVSVGVGVSVAVNCPYELNQKRVVSGVKKPGRSCCVTTSRRSVSDLFSRGDVEEMTFSMVMFLGVKVFVTE
jgi:thioredoxin reductase